MSRHPKPDTIAAADGQPLAARFFAPAGAARGAVIIAPAMGVGQEYYADFAHWLAQQGYAAITFDYRGMGHSRRGSLRGFKADIFDWARLDCGAAAEALTQRFPGVPLTWIGHSLGGQILAFFPQHARLAKAITVGTGSGYWRENVWTLKSYVWWLWYVIVPLTLPLFDYFPGRRLKKVGDLPRGVMAQWRRWCLHRDYAVGVEGEPVRRQYAAVTTPIVSLSFTDDEFMSAKNTASLHGFYTGAAKTMKRIAPRDVGARRIGHFGFFRRRFAETLWARHLLPELA
ncbi:alpha/beta fold hydrolase [Azospira restricta]|uniref:Alpha/beta fold hydrolase n=1 Tax=Azospira restricta TaxID=404405 RepID=A0A974PYS2_9RHOO|nr:alpha/beta fold hydrolase [Azospira restricta]QRJ63440.1 alpha/beta fold hydrolase [Azospira restricta]